VKQLCCAPFYVHFLFESVVVVLYDIISLFIGFIVVVHSLIRNLPKMSKLEMNISGYMDLQILEKSGHLLLRSHHLGRKKMVSAVPINSLQTSHLNTSSPGSFFLVTAMGTRLVFIVRHIFPLSFNTLHLRPILGLKLLNLLYIL